MQWGLIFPPIGNQGNQQEEAVQLLGVDVSARIIDFSAEVDITQVYYSQAPTSREAVGK